jgi:hypothetical protein
MEITIRAAQLNAQEIQLDDQITLQEIKLSGTDIRLTSGPRGPMRIADLNGSVIVTEASLNLLLKRKPPEGTRDLEVATLTGRIRITGKHMFGPIPVPFALIGVPEIEGGARIRLNVQSVNVLGPVPLPSVAVQGIGGAINKSFSEGFDATKLPIPIRLTGLVVEPGRLTLTATATVEIRPVAPLETTELVKDTA